MSRPGLIDLGDVAIGVAIRAGESATEAWKRLREAGERTTGSPRWKELAERGAVERNRGRARAAEALDAAMTAIATSPLVNRIVAIQVDRVLSLLEQEPERIRVLVRGQRDSMVGEVVGRVRTGAAAGDAAVDRLTLRMSRRGGAAEPT
ncbi:hypothetical protein AB0M02_14550 [Actinoplanes sp. NPDC051861]|uniref:hypothetical protein n=1 Tax=Actinoplanes sp. NPDC051861 TaxID=3155170 RepID=UPI0034454A55